MIEPASVKYQEHDADNARWDGFEFREGDIIISAPAKSGTTWTQLLVALLLFDGPDFPAPMSRLSPWMDQKIRSTADVHAMFDAQGHRRFIKTHTPLDGVPYGADLRYVCVGRDPRDAAVSMVHHSANMDRARFGELLAPQRDPALPDPPPRGEFVESDYFDRFIDDESVGPAWSLRFLAHHYASFWQRRHLANVELFHFTDYWTDLPSELQRLALHLNIEISPDHAGQLAQHAALDRVRARAEDVAPEAHMGLFKDTPSFFRSGSAGEWRHRMSADQQSRYDVRARQLMSPELRSWVHHGRLTA